MFRRIVLIACLLIAGVLFLFTSKGEATPALQFGENTIYLPQVFNNAQIVPPVIPQEMITIPAGEFLMGCDPAHNGGFDCSSIELPLHPVYLDEYQIDKYEVTNAMYAECVAAGSCMAPPNVSSMTRSSYYDNQLYTNYPIIYANWDDAVTYCTWAGKRLPTEAEWEKAAHGTIPLSYPWGDAALDCSLANYANESGTGGPCVGDTSQVGTYPQGASPYGVMDMTGNVYEWINDWMDWNYYATSPYSNPPGPAVPGLGLKTMRGGSFLYSDSFLNTSDRNWVFPTNRDASIGFRCAVSSAP